MPTKTEPRCVKMVWHPGGFAGHRSQCPRAGKLEYKGELYCKQHHPPSVKAREESHPKCAAERCTVNVNGTKYCSFHADVTVPRDGYLMMERKAEAADGLLAALKQILLEVDQALDKGGISCLSLTSKEIAHAAIAQAEKP